MQSPPGMQRDRSRARRIEFLSGLETNITYVTIAELSERENVKPKVIRYALAKGYLIAARRQSGRAGVLIHPDEANRWSEARKKKQC